MTKSQGRINAEVGKVTAGNYSNLLEALGPFLVPTVDIEAKRVFEAHKIFKFAMVIRRPD